MCPSRVCVCLCPCARPCVHGRPVRVRVPACPCVRGRPVRVRVPVCPWVRGRLCPRARPCVCARVQCLIKEAPGHTLLEGRGRLGGWEGELRCSSDTLLSPSPQKPWSWDGPSERSVQGKGPGFVPRAHRSLEGGHLWEGIVTLDAENEPRRHAHLSHQPPSLLQRSVDAFLPPRALAVHTVAHGREPCFQSLGPRQWGGGGGGAEEAAWGRS